MGRQTPDGDTVKIMAWEIASYNCNNLLCFAIAKKKSKKRRRADFCRSGMSCLQTGVSQFTLKMAWQADKLIYERNTKILDPYLSQFSIKKNRPSDLDKIQREVHFVVLR